MARAFSAGSPRDPGRRRGRILRLRQRHERGGVRPGRATSGAGRPGTVRGGSVPIYLRGIGTVTAYNTVLVKSQIQGQLIDVPFTEEQFVHKGDLLAQIDPRPYQAALDQAIANRDHDVASL